MYIFDIVEITLLLALTAIYIVQCPFNKVEESFNTQAVHDFLHLFPNKLPYQDYALVETVKKNRGVTWHSELEVSQRDHFIWDHVEFPGVVPRTFIGAVIVGLPLKLVKYLMSSTFMSDSQDLSDLGIHFVLQMSSRFALSAFVALSIGSLTRAIQRRYGISYRLCFLMTTVSQFHYMFYASRFLPNTYAAILANLTLACWLNRQFSKGIIYIALCVIIFRFDTALFFGWLIIDGIFIKKQVSLIRVLKVGIPAGIIAILMTLVVDSVFWSRLVWPELEGLYFNIWLNKSSEWGTQPYLWYIYSCIPRLLLFSSPFLLLADHKVTRDHLLPTLAFIFTYSILPHKELRFILFVVPTFNICISSGLLNIRHYLLIFLERMRFKRSRLISNSIFIITVCAICVANFIASYTLMKISSANYPGGQAAITVGTARELHQENIRSAVYVNNLAAQTGFSRFLQVNGTYYSKSPQLDETTFTKSYNLIYLILEPSKVGEFLDICTTHNGAIDTSQMAIVQWRKTGHEVKCTIANQPPMYCSIADTIQAVKSVRFPDISKFKSLVSLISTYPALEVIRCSIRSKFNPFQ